MNSLQRFINALCALQALASILDEQPHLSEFEREALAAAVLAAISRN